MASADDGDRRADVAVDTKAVDDVKDDKKDSKPYSDASLSEKGRKDSRQRSRSRSRSPARSGSSSRRRSSSRSRRRSRSRSRTRSRSRSRSRDRDRRRRRDRSASSSSDSDASSSASGSESDSDDKRRRRHKKEDRKSKKSKRDKHKKEKKHKRSSRKEKKKKDGSAHDFGKFGVIRDSDQFRKEQEFTLWLVEVKKISPDSISMQDSRKLFLDYVEDYNTATLPHRKYYNYDAYMAERRAKDDKKAAKDAALGGVVPTIVDDEAALRQQAKQRAEQNRALLQNMYAHPERLADLRRLEQERVQLDRDRKLGLKSKSDTGVRFETRYL